MNDFETAVDQILASPDGEDNFGEFENYGAGELYPDEQNEAFADYEGLYTDGLDSEFDIFDEPESEGAFGMGFESGSDGDDLPLADFEFYDDDDWQGEVDSFFGEFGDQQTGSMLSDSEVEELAQDLVGVATPEDMEAFFGKIFKGIKKAAGKTLRSGIGKKLLKAGSGLLGRALPIVGSTLGTALLPGIGTGLGGALGGQLKNLFSRGGRRSLGRTLTRQAVGSARRVAQRNPLTSLIGRQGGNALKSLFGFEAESADGDPQMDLARRVIRTVADAAEIASRNDNESDTAIADAYRQAAGRNLPLAVRAAMLSGPIT